MSSSSPLPPHANANDPSTIITIIKQADRAIKQATRICEKVGVLENQLQGARNELKTLLAMIEQLSKENEDLTRRLAETT